MREIKFRAWDGLRMTTSGVMFNSTNGHLFSAENMPLMQYTGLKDSSGVEIYEGDLLLLQKPASNKPVLVEFKNEYVGGWVLTHPSTDMHISLGARNQDELLVIGNIYENPDLLEQEQ